MQLRATTCRRAALCAALKARHGHLPPRYDDGGREFEDRVADALIPGLRILDAGSGRRPAIPVPRRPVDCHYVGLDLSLSELEGAPEGSYDEKIAGDITRRIGKLEGRFDLIVSLQVLEHVKPLDEALENLRSYLLPGGRLITQLSGTLSIFGLANRLLPNRLGAWVLCHVSGRRPESVFPAYYDRCWNSALKGMLDPWSKAEVVPLWQGAAYFAFFKPIMALYIAYEEWARLADRRNLASHYVITAIR